MNPNAAAQLEQDLCGLPILEYAFVKTGQISFSRRVREVCRTECPRYGTSWSCPPAVGSVEECRDRCLAFENCFVFSTIAEVADTEDMTRTLPTRMAHEEVTRQVVRIFKGRFKEVLALSAESCGICEKCTFPDKPCRHPDKMFPCVESYGILVTEMARKGGLTYQGGAGTITWFSLVFFE